jgi:peptidoglycan-associated lipoprotein
MKIVKLFTVLAFLSVCSITAVTAQNKEADKLYLSGKYFDAIEIYKKAATKEKNKTKKAEMTFKTGDCYRLINDTKQSEVWFAKAIKAKYPDPIATLYLADAKKVNEKYSEAIVDYNEYSKLVPSDPRGAEGAKSCEMAQKWKDNPTRYEVTNLGQINTKDQDFCPTYADKKYLTLYFTSARPGATGNAADGTTGQSYTDIYETKIDKKGAFSSPTIVAGPINSNDNEGASAINKKGSRIYFTRCDIEKKTLGCAIFYSDKKGTSWGDPVNMNLTTDTGRVGHPAINDDETIIYFTATDLPGGMGGKDIWKVEFDKKTKAWGKPVNLGPTINTSGDEMYPYIASDGTLYFSSNGQSGMGGLDVFKAEKSGDGFTNIQNMKYPINSAGDDFGIIFQGTKQKGYFTSNRAGGKGSDDIYSFNLPPILFSLNGTITDIDTKDKLVGAVVKLVGSDGSSVETKSDANGYYKFDVTPEGKRFVNEKTSYTISASMEKYFGNKASFTTVGVEVATDFTKDIALKTTKVAIRLPEIRYDLAKWDLKPQYQDSLNGLLQTLNDNPNLVVELGSHTDSRGDNKSNAKLAQKRAQSVVDYLIAKGVAADRLVAKGYGEEQLLIKDAEINAQKTKEAKEEMHAKNRRTTFKVLREDYVPKKDPNAPPPVPTKIEDASGQGEEGDE